MLTKVTLDYHGHHGAYLAKSVPIAPFDSAGAIALPCFLLVIAFLAEPLPTSLAPFGFGFAFAGVAAFGLGVAFGFAFGVAAAFGFDCVGGVCGASARSLACPAFFRSLARSAKLF